MNARISAMMCLLCVLGSSDLTWAEDPYSQRVADPYAISSGLPTMSSGTPELYFSVMAGVAIPFSHDATFQDGTQPTVVENVDYQMKHSWGGSAGIWFPTRHKLLGFDLGVELTGYVWYPDVACCRDFYNNDPATNQGTTTEVGGVYVGPNFLIRYPMAISDAYPNGRWHPYVGIGVGAHQMAMKPGGARGQSLFAAITDQRDTTIGFQALGGIKAHLFKYVAAFVEAKYLYAHHRGLSTDRFAQSAGGNIFFDPNSLVVNPYSSTIDTILVHAGISMHFDWKP
jgi:opacity protein-like surface antigen